MGIRNILLTGLLLWVSLSFADDVRIKAELEPDTALVGDWISFSLFIEHDQGIKVDLPQLQGRVGDLEVIKPGEWKSKKSKGRIIDQMATTCAVYDTGHFVIPEIPIFYQKVGDTTRYQINSQPLGVFIASVLDSSVTDILDIKGPVAFPRPLREKLFWAMIFMIPLALGALAYIYVKRKKGGPKKILAAPPPLVPPHEWAYQELEKLKGSSLLLQGKFKAYYSRASEIVCTYLERRYPIRAVEMTSTELIEWFSQSKLSDGILEMVRSFLEKCDLVKFAKHRPLSQENEEVLLQAYQIVDRTKLGVEKCWGNETPKRKKQSEL